MNTSKSTALKKAHEWVDANPTKELEFYCEENVSATNSGGMSIIDILQKDAKTEDDLVNMIAKVQWYKKYVERA